MHTSPVGHSRFSRTSARVAVALLGLFALLPASGCGERGDIKVTPRVIVPDGGTKSDAGTLPEACKKACEALECGKEPHCGLDCGSCTDGTACTPDGKCGGCTTDAHCAKNPAGGKCDVEGYRCVMCLADIDCETNPLGPYCDPVSNMCKTCAPGSCEGRVCGTVPDSCGVLNSCGSCGTLGSCDTKGKCVCPADPLEPNDSRLNETQLPEMSDLDNPSIERTASIHSSFDYDFFEFKVADKGLDGNPTISVSVQPLLPDSSEGWTLGPDKSEYEVTIWYSCNSGGDEGTCQPDDARAFTDIIGRGCAKGGNFAKPPTVQFQTQCSGINESGVALVRVRKTTRAGRCDSYKLTITVR